jgi:hypothetical protein
MPESSSLPAINSTLRPFFDQAVYGTEMLDYSIDGVTSEPATADGKQKQYVSTVNLRRKGDFVLPVTVEVVFEDGTRLREHWDGADRWTRFSYTRTAKIASVEIDPGHVVPLDRNLFNNSTTMSWNTVPADKLTAIWLTIQQLGQQLIAWVV